MYRSARTFLASAIALASLAAVPVQAQDQPNDAKCLLVSNMFSKGAEDEKARDTAMRASFFYLGRVTGSAAEVKARLVTEAKALSPQNSAPIMTACANAMVARAEQLSGSPGSTRPPAQGR